jgi:hypothetical protein
VALRSKFKPFTPWKAPTSPPPGTYDPQFDAALRAAQRGFGDMQGDAHIQSARAGVDYDQAAGGINAGRDRTLAGLLASKARGLQDIGTGRSRLGEDHSRATDTLARSFRHLGHGQTEAARAGGVALGGTLGASRRQRRENQAFQQVDIDRARNRGMQDFATNEQRLTDDTNTLEGYARDDAATQLGQLGQGFEREYGPSGDLARRLAVGARELGFFGADTAESKFFQAQQAGYAVPGRGEPGGAAKNEFTGAQGPYRVIQQGGYNVRVSPAGKVLSKTRRKK